MSLNPSFVDEIVLTVASGHGGAGSTSFRREKYVPRGGPDGGDGGCGGNVLFKVQSNLKTLTHLRPNKTYKAENGFPGAGRKRHGRDGADLVLAVPPGTRIWDAESGELLLDLLKTETTNNSFLVGGIGGKGNIHFATSRNQAPRFSQPGMPGGERKIKLELAIIADIGFLGYPNAGKSSLLSVLTSATPEIANYPFTTKIPNLGVLRQYGRDIVLADIPGIIDGASKGLGLGHRFLKHISRTLALLFLIDLSNNEDPVKTLAKLKQELQAFDPELLNREHYIVATKMDILEAKERLPAFAAEVKDEVIPISSVTREGLETLVRKLFDLCAQSSPVINNIPDYFSYDPGGQDGS